MIFKQVFDTKTSTYTYLIASAKGREAIIIDPVIENVNEYIQLLKDLDLKLVKVIDTHIHADHVTGASKLKEVTNCSTLMGEHTPADAVEIKVKDKATSITGTVANPSKPSVKLTAFDAPIITNNPKGIKNNPMYQTKFLKKGK